jgi:hypothetical protein
MNKNLKLIALKVVGEFLFLFGLLSWVYGVLFQFIFPEWLTGGLSHFTPWIRVDTFTIIGFIVAAVGFLMWRLAKELST